jgi:hypothetical protein
VKNFQEHPQSVINALFKNSHIPSHVRKPLLHKESDGRKSRPIRSLEDEIIWDIIQTKISPSKDWANLTPIALVIVI